MEQEITETPHVARPPASKVYQLARPKDVNAKIMDGMILYHWHLRGVENHAVRIVLKHFKDVYAFLDDLFSDKNIDLLRLLGDARVLPSVVPIKEAAEVSVPLSSQTIMEARKSGSKQPLSPFGVRAVVDYLVNEIDTHINSMVSIVARTMQQAVIQVADAEPKIVSDIIRRVFPDIVKSKIKGGIVVSDEPPIDRMVKIITGAGVYEGALKKRYSKVMTKVDAKLVSGLMQGKGTKAIATDVRGVLNKELAGGAATLVRTAIQRAAAQSGKELYGHNKDIIKAEVWVATLDIDLCLQCGHLDGQRFAVGVGPQPIDDTHLSCRCLRSPVVKSWRDLGINATDAPAGLRASMGGAIPSRTTFEDWFADQSDSVQREILGAGRFKLYQDGTLGLEDFATNTRVYTMKQLRKKYKV